MGLNLYQHNQTAYEAADRLMEETGKAAVIHPTGTGKSLIAFRLAEEHPNQKLLWLAPSAYIFQTQLENLKRMQSEEVSFPNIRFLTYAKLTAETGEKETAEAERMEAKEKITVAGSGTGKEKIIAAESRMGKTSEEAPDYIVLDEFHRCGASEWGKSVKKLLARYPKAKVLGLSATNIRYLDGQRDMAEELFEGNIASEMTLGEAIAKKILPAPTYVISMYSYQGELKNLEQRIAVSKNPELRKENEKILEELKRTLENAEGLDRIFAGHMQKKDGKYIVFCSGKAHMEEMTAASREWFRLVDKKPHIYRAVYDDPQSNREFRAFQEDGSCHLKLLFCIDMLNEGVHVEDIDGVILLRPTVSPILYLQQIGRSLSAGKKKQPVIFDIVNNFDNLYSIDCLKNEIEDAFARMPDLAAEKRKFYETFRIVDEARDCRMLFDRLAKNLSASWEVYYRAAECYRKTYGNLCPPKSYVTPEGLPLGSWLMTQRRIRLGRTAGNLSGEQIRRLDDLGMEWESGSERSFRRGYDALKQYVQKNGNADVKASYVAEDGFALGKWMTNIRQNRNLNREQEAALEQLGMVWDQRSRQWERNFHAAEEYYRQHGNLLVPQNYRTKEGVSLGLWVANQRRIYEGKKRGAAPLGELRIKRLDGIGMVWKKEQV